jgi:hypothetical protein
MNVSSSAIDDPSIALIADDRRSGTDCAQCIGWKYRSSAHFAT